jgi:hypothetical protein
MEMCRDWRFTPHYSLPLMPAIRSLLGAPLVTHETASVPARSPLGRRCNPDGPRTAKPTAARSSFVPACEKVLGFAKRYTHETTVSASPVLFALSACRFPTRSRYPFFSKVFSFSISKGPVDKRCGSMQENINGKLNYLGQYFVGLLPGQRLAKDRAISSSIRRSDD